MPTGSLIQKRCFRGGWLRGCPGTRAFSTRGITENYFTKDQTFPSLAVVRPHTVFEGLTDQSDQGWGDPSYQFLPTFEPCQFSAKTPRTRSPAEPEESDNGHHSLLHSSIYPLSSLQASPEPGTASSPVDTGEASQHPCLQGDHTLFRERQVCWPLPGSVTNPSIPWSELSA